MPENGHARSREPHAASGEESFVPRHGRGDRECMFNRRSRGSCLRDRLSGIPGSPCGGLDAKVRISGRYPWRPQEWQSPSEMGLRSPRWGLRPLEETARVETITRNSLELIAVSAIAVIGKTGQFQ